MFYALMQKKTIWGRRDGDVGRTVAVTIDKKRVGEETDWYRHAETQSRENGRE